MADDSGPSKPEPPSLDDLYREIDRCRCGRRVQGRQPLQTTDALGAASTHLGPQTVALIVPAQ